MMAHRSLIDGHPRKHLTFVPREKDKLYQKRVFAQEVRD
jgi:hypothetical protein